MFVRFVVGTQDQHHKWLTGVITEARLLRDANKLEPHEVIWLEETYAWLNEHLPCPPFSNSNWPSDAVSWFKDNAGDAVKKMWEIVALLKQHSIPVRMLQSKNPGKILYEDEYQIVVEEWKQI